MARFFFHLHECGVITEDPEGLERDDLESVRVEAVRAAREVMCAEVNGGKLCLDCCIDVVDGRGKPVLTLPFKEALAITGL